MHLGSLSQKCFESITKCGKYDKKDDAARLAVRGEGFPRLGEAFYSGKLSAKSKNVYNKSC